MGKWCIWFLFCVLIDTFETSLYGIVANEHGFQRNSVVQYLLSNKIETQSVITSSNIFETDIGLTCYDPIYHRYYYLYQTIPQKQSEIHLGIWIYDLYNNVSLNPIHLEKYLKVHQNLDNAFLLTCNPNNGNLYIFGTSNNNKKDCHLYSISFNNNAYKSYNKQLSYKVTLIQTYYDFNTLENDSYINQPHTFDSNRNRIWFAHYYGNMETENKWIWYNIDILTGVILSKNKIIDFPMFTYLDYHANIDKIIGATIDSMDNIEKMTINIYHANLTISQSFGGVSGFYPCEGNGISTIDLENNIWYIMHKVILQSPTESVCSNTVISSFDISSFNNIKYINSSSSICNEGNISNELCSYDIVDIKYFDAINVSITIDNNIINKTNDAFVSYTIDMAQIDNKAVNISDPTLIYLASQLSPNILRIGGTDTDYTYYKVGDENPCHLPVTNSSQHSYYCYTMSEVEELVSFAKQTGSKLVFALSMGYPLFPTSNADLWNSSNTQQFLQYLHDIKNYTNNDIYGFELGNELSNNPYTSAYPQANAFVTLNKVIKQIWNLNHNDNQYFHLFGFDNAGKTLYGSGNFSYFAAFVNQTCDVLSGLTYHCYIGGNSTDELNPEWLDKQYKISNRVSSIFTNYSRLCASSSDPIGNFNRIKNNVIAGEMAYHSGENVQPNLLNTYIDGFWYNDALGILGNLGQPYLFRQTLADNGYGLLNKHYQPHPDYYLAVLYKNLMSGNVIGIYSDQQYLRIYSRCLNTKRPMRNINNLSNLSHGIAVIYINLFSEKANLRFNANILSKNTKTYIWELTSLNETNLLCGYMNLNGVKLELDKDGKVPNLNGRLIKDINTNNGNINITVPKLSYGIIVFTQTTIDLCQ